MQSGGVVGWMKLIGMHDTIRVFSNYGKYRLHLFASETQECRRDHSADCKLTLLSKLQDHDTIYSYAEQAAVFRCAKM